MNLPNKITTFRMIMVGVIFLLLVVSYGANIAWPVYGSFDGYHISLLNIIVCALFLIASFSDFLDGHIARKYNLVTTYGKFMDPIADKLLVDVLLLFYALPMTEYGFGLTGKTGVPMVVVIIMICRDLCVDAIRLLGMEKQVVIQARYAGKVKTVLQMIALTCVLLNNFPFAFFSWKINVANLLCYLAGVASLVSLVDYFVVNRKVFQGDDK